MLSSTSRRDAACWVGRDIQVRVIGTGVACSGCHGGVARVWRDGQCLEVSKALEMVRVRVRGASKFDPQMSDEGVIGTERNPGCSRDVSGSGRAACLTRSDCDHYHVRVVSWDIPRDNLNVTARTLSLSLPTPQPALDILVFKIHRLPRPVRRQSFVRSLSVTWTSERRFLGSPKDDVTVRTLPPPLLRPQTSTGPLFDHGVPSQRHTNTHTRSLSGFAIGSHHLNPSLLGYPKDFPPGRSRSLAFHSSTSIVVFAAQTWS
jgi:hypothetical protein